MPLHPLPVVTALALGCLTAQVPPLPGAAATPQQRFVDFSRDLARPGVAVVTGRLGKLKEGRRERLPDGVLGGSGAVTVVAGTQYFRVPVETTVTPVATFVGAAGPVPLAFELQLARLPDGSEHRQARTGTGASLAEGTLALFVTAPPEPGRGKKGKAHTLLHVIAFDAAADAGSDAQHTFVDAMHDVTTVNRRMHDLQVALDAHERAAPGEAKAAATKVLQDLLAAPPTLRQAANDALLTMHVAPLEQRARQRVGAAAPTDKR
jgi:hypothetical protein